MGSRETRLNIQLEGGNIGMNRTLLVAIFLVSLASLASGSTDCNFVINGSVMTLTVNCSTDASIVVPDGFTADLGGFTVTAVDPVGDHFRGGVLVSGVSRANVTNGTITASNLATVTSCDDLAHALRGVLFNGASG